MTRWAQAPMDRMQRMVFCPTLDDMIDEDHPARLFDEILAGCDWSSWEAYYEVKVGQPAIHPRVVASAILYGLSRGIRPSRNLEWACSNNLDFLWLVQGRSIDHSTFCGFRKRFRKELKALFGEVAHLAMRMGLIRLNQVALDGTKVKANSSAHGTVAAKTIEARVAALDAEIERMFCEADEADTREDALFGEHASPTKLPKGLTSRIERKARLEKALASTRGRAEDAKVPVADPDSTIQPNKEGGFAPNYTPMAAVDAHRGFIVSADVLADGDEGSATVPMVDAVTQDLDEQPAQLLADAAHGSGANLSQLDERGVEAYIPLQGREDHPENPAHRADPTQPVAESDWPKLPRNPRTKKLDRSAFIYDAESGRYYCPMGRALEFHQAKAADRSRNAGYRVYRCASCAGCPLSGECIAGKKGKPRTVSRDEHEPLREAMDVRMSSESGQKVYARRLWAGETPYAVIKVMMKLRQFLLRGLEKVKTEWLWAVTSFNIWKLVREVARLRARFAALMG